MICSIASRDLLVNAPVRLPPSALNAADLWCLPTVTRTNVFGEIGNSPMKHSASQDSSNFRITYLDGMIAVVKARRVLVISGQHY